MSKIYIECLDKKPEHCADCPMCNEYDDCDLLPTLGGAIRELPST